MKKSRYLRHGISLTVYDALALSSFRKCSNHGLCILQVFVGRTAQLGFLASVIGEDFACCIAFLRPVASP